MPGSDDTAATKTTREVAEEYLREEYNITLADLNGDETSRLALERDLALRQAKLSKADLQVIEMALTESRPLEALRTCNEALERLDDELEAIDDA